jgi:hypothetical protein
MEIRKEIIKIGKKFIKEMKKPMPDLLALTMFSTFSIIYLIVLAFIVPGFFTNLLFNVKVDPVALLISLFIIIIISVIWFWGTQKAVRILSKRVAFLNKVNNYLIFAVFLSIIIMSIGWASYQIMYEPSFPLLSQSEKNVLTNLTVDLKCYGGFFYLNPVYGDKFFCFATILNPSNTNYKFKQVSIFDSTYATDNTTFKKEILYSTEILNNSNETIKIEFPIGEPTIHYFRMYFYFTGDTNNPTLTVKNVNYLSLTIEEYLKRTNERLALLVLLVSIGIFSVFSVVNNIKNIVEKREKWIKVYKDGRQKR